MTAEALVIAVTGIVVGALFAWDRARVRRRLRQIDDAIAAQGTALGARVDKLQNIVADRGWRDSMLLTRFDWRKPEDRG